MLWRTVAAAWVVLLLGRLCSAGVMGDSLVIDSFDYANATEARRAWKAAGDSPPIEVARHGAGRAGAFFCDWSKVDKRISCDRAVSLDLGRYGRIAMWVYTDAPEAILSGTLYLRSGDGWYVGPFAVRGKGWQRVTIDRTGFKPEGSPAGWDTIRTVRLAFWKAPQATATAMVAVDDITAHAAPIVIVRGLAAARRGAGEAGDVDENATFVAKLLGDAGLPYSMIDDADVVRGRLAGAKLAIYPYNPDVSPAEADAVVRFLGQGGKVMLFYCLPKPLAGPLGVLDVGWAREATRGQFASVRIDGSVLEGAPPSIGQNSWNIRKVVVEPGRARSAGQWVGADGRAGGIPAVVVSPAGMFMGHVLTPMDEQAKRRFLLAAVAALAPEWKAELAGMVLRHALVADDLPSMDEVRRLVEGARSQGTQDGRKMLAEAEQIIRGAALAVADERPGSFATALDASDQARRLVQEALYQSFPPWRAEFRAVWCHSAFGLTGKTWDESIRHLKDCGFNAILVNVLWGGQAYYPSEVVPVAAEVAAGGDPLAECLAACRKHGVELHVWAICWNLYGAPASFVARMRREGRLQADSDGKEIEWLSPSHPANFRMQRDAMLEVVRRYAVDGLQFDYIRYASPQTDFSAGAKARFEQAAGVKVARWPRDVISGRHAAAFADWRRSQITELVRQVSAEARKIRPGVKVSAAVYPRWPHVRESIGQDWVAWARAGYLDFLCPMNYTESDDAFAAMLKEHMKLAGPTARVYPGVGVTASSSTLSPFEVVLQLSAARRLGARGFVLFSYNEILADRHMPALRKGILAE